MSKLAKIPVAIKEGITVAFEGESIRASGPKGSLSFKIPSGIKVEIVDARLYVTMEDKNDDEMKAFLGLTRATLANIVAGVSSGFEKKLELSGVGYRAQVVGTELILSVGFSHTVKLTAPNGITFSVSDNVITVSGIDKGLVGNTAAKIRSIRPQEPYKGKGIRYVGERIRKKVGKAAKALGAK